MKAMQLISPGPVEHSPLTLKELARPTPGRGEVLLRVRACAVCHTDLHIAEGELPPKRIPVIPGHQIVGVVESAGADSGNHLPGDRVGLPWLYSTDGSCEYCIGGQENLCSNARFTGYDVDGGFAEFVIASDHFVYPIPKHFTDVDAAPLLCAGIVGYRALRRSGIRPGERLGLFGFGASAHIVLQIARHRGCEVYVFSRGDHHRKLAEELGATWTGSSDDVPPHLLHSAISFAPSGELVPRALAVLRKGGTLALAGITMSPIPSLEYATLYHERTLCSVANSTRQDAVDFLKVAAEIPVKTRVQAFPLSDANRALQRLKTGSINGAAVLTMDH